MDIKTMMKQKWFIPAAVVVGLVLIGSVVRSSREHSMEQAIENATGHNADVDVNGDQVHVKTNEGEWSSGGTVPSDWPSDVPVYPGSKVQYSASANPATGGAGSYLALSSSDDASKVTAYYKDQLAAKGWTVGSSAQVNGATYMTAKKADRDLSLTVTPADGGSSIMIGVAKE